MAGATEALLLLARAFESQGAVLEAIKCHTALCSGGKPLPVLEVESQLALANLLIAHTHNIQEARQRLERAQSLAAKLSKAYVTKCRVASALANCQGLQGEQRLQRQTLQRALDLCQKPSSPDERDELALWHARLLMQLAASVAEQSASDAIQYLDLACDVAPAGQMVIPLLGKVQFCASLGSITEAEAALTQADSLVNGMPADSARQWRVHHWLLTRLLQLWKGNTLALQQTEAEIGNLISVLEGHLESVSSGSWQGAWLPREATCALACLVTACALRPGVEVKQALALVQRGLDHAQQGLNAEAVAPEAGEAFVAAGARRSVQALLLLQCLLRECAVLAHLTMTEHGPAQQHILAMRQLLGRFPSLLPGALHSIQMVTGHYLQSLGLHTKAAAAYDVAATSCGTQEPSSGSRRVAELYKGLALAGSGTPDAVEAACAILNSSSEEPDQDPMPILVLRELLGSVVAGCQGEAKQRKHLLSKALKRAHNVLGNHQLVSQVLNALAPLQQEQGDVSGADSMLKSSFTLSKNLQDLPSQVQALAAIIDLKRVTKERPEQIAEAETYHERKQRQVQQLREAALSSAAHQQIAASSV